MDPLTAVLTAAVAAYVLVSLAQLAVEVGFRMDRRRHVRELASDRIETRTLLASAHATQLQVTELAAVARGYTAEIQQLLRDAVQTANELVDLDPAKHSATSRTAAMPPVPRRPTSPTSPPRPGAAAARPKPYPPSSDAPKAH